MRSSRVAVPDTPCSSSYQRPARRHASTPSKPTAGLAQAVRGGKALPAVPGYRRGESGRGSDAVQRCSATAAAPAAAGHLATADVPVEAARRPAINQAADLNTILEERDACGVGFIADLNNVPGHDVVEKSLMALGCMEHRGGCSADNDSGDGAGLLTNVPWELFKRDLPDLKEAHTGVGMLFMPQDPEAAAAAAIVVEKVVAAEGRCRIAGWREVPSDNAVVGRMAKAEQPIIRQVFIEHQEGATGADLERELFIIRKLIEREKAALGDAADDFYICSLSNRTIVYKGMLRSAVLGQFYKDLQDPLYKTPFAIYHRRYSTNTTPKWPLAQPMRCLGHNGEINTLQGNLNWVASREHSLNHPVWGGREHEFLPLTSAKQSDSANLDNVAELMVRTGVDLEEALMVLVPEAYRNHPDLMANYPEVVDFYEFYEGLQEGWDGPALLVFSDGNHVGARLDRNGLRPARYWVTSDNHIFVASEVGVLNDVLDNADKVIAKGRLGPGQMVLADIAAGTFKTNTEIARDVARKHPYKEWLGRSRRLEELGASKGFLKAPLMTAADALKLQASSGLGAEDTQMIIESMAMAGAEPTFCMGDDTPLPVLSSKPHQLSDYFKQRFAQVTNPPIDPLREGLVMSLEMRLGKRGNLLTPGPDSYAQLLLKSPVLLESELAAVTDTSGLSTRTFRLHYQSGDPGAMEAALRKLCADVEAAVKNGCEVLILSDRLPEGEEHAVECPPIPALLAVGAVHHHLIRTGLRTETSIVADTAQCVSTHQLAVMVGYGAHAVCPYLGFETARQWRSASRTEALIKSGKVADVSITAAQKNYKKALEKGLLKILSKMGISLLSCYHGAQIFEIYGLGKEVVDLAFFGSVSRIGGLSLADAQRESESFWVKGFPEKASTKLEDYGYIQSRPKGEYHANNQQMSKLLHKAVQLGGKGPGVKDAFDAYSEHFRNSPAHVLRDCLELVSDAQPISVDEVEPAEAIMTRFCTGGMSLGAISRETHETIAIAMNRIGGKSNSGEGGEDPVRWDVMQNVDADGVSPSLPHLKGLQNGDMATSRIKQVASGRFGVTPEFLVNADQLEIKIAQGAKPGEGGQLPGKKVSPYIANLRRSKPGVPLISPPPHHDIYSIEDLAQLIYDLHMVAPRSQVSVKLVAQAGIGTVASGVAKAAADVIQISGHDGGTGASPVSSIKHAGGPVEMGLADAHQTLVKNELRERVVLRVDGGMRSGRDVMVAAALGGDEYGFGTVAMIATGCIMARVCHTNNCPVGVASQREELRARFPGAPGDLVNYFHFIAEEVRAGLASLGLRSLDELVGRADLLRQRDMALAKTTGLDLSFITTYAGPVEASSKRIAQAVHDIGPVWDDEVLADPEVQAAIRDNGTVRREYIVTNQDRSALGRIGGAVARVHGVFSKLHRQAPTEQTLSNALAGDRGFAGTISLDLRGSGGQSFGCFLAGGIEVKLTGEANDYIGKGMAGGELVIVPPPGHKYAAEEASLVGNTCLYGATGGRLFVNGRAGERFAVRNSMAQAVVEGTGDHCCEYMTGGVVVCLGTVGRNVAAGMTGGIGYFYDIDGAFEDKVNEEIVSIQRVRTAAGEAQLKQLIQDHVERTGSKRGSEILGDWSSAVGKFWQLVPPSEESTPEASPDAESLLSAEVPSAVPMAA